MWWLCEHETAIREPSQCSASYFMHQIDNDGMASFRTISQYPTASMVIEFNAGMRQRSYMWLQDDFAILPERCFKMIVLRLSGGKSARDDPYPRDTQSNQRRSKAFDVRPNIYPASNCFRLSQPSTAISSRNDDALWQLLQHSIGQRQAIFMSTPIQSNASEPAIFSRLATSNTSRRQL